MEKTVKSTDKQYVVSTGELLEHWQGHRRLTRKVIEAFPEKELFSHRIGGMRTFADMVSELLSIAGPGIEEIVTGKTGSFDESNDWGGSKQKMLQQWDKTTVIINRYWEELNADKFRQAIKLFGQYDGTVLSSIQYFVDNEIHHRGQGYVYLRSLGVEPPAFWER
jgi:uncharacterized damage-inducible protein DinB